MTIMEFEKEQSSLIREVWYDEEARMMYFFFRGFPKDHILYNVPREVFKEFTEAKSFGKFYLDYLKPFFKQNKTTIMADRVIKLKINVEAIKKEWLFKGEKGTYLNVTLLYNEKEDNYGNNGMIVQDVPKEVYKNDKSLKGPILGNGKVWNNEGAAPLEARVGTESGTMAKDLTTPLDDLPF